MNDETGFLAAVLKELATSTAVILAAWGALGGATNALTTRMRLRDALRHILLGGLIAAGMGSLKLFDETSFAPCLDLPGNSTLPGHASRNPAVTEHCEAALRARHIANFELRQCCDVVHFTTSTSSSPPVGSPKP